MGNWLLSSVADVNWKKNVSHLCATRCGIFLLFLYDIYYFLFIFVS